MYLEFVDFNVNTFCNYVKSIYRFKMIMNIDF